MSLRLQKLKYTHSSILRRTWLRGNTEATEAKRKRLTKVWNKGTYLSTTFDGLPIVVYKGNKFIKLKVSKLILLKKVGEFTFSRKPFYYPSLKKSK